MNLSDTVVGAIIGGFFGFIGIVFGLFLNSWNENKKAKREREKEVRLRIVGELIQTSEVMDFIRSQRKIDWPRF